MDSDDEMMMLSWKRPEVHATADEEEQLTVFNCLLQLQATELNNAAPHLVMEVQSLGEGRERKGRGCRVMTCHMVIILPTVHIVPACSNLFSLLSGTLL
jgi:hypothetical protein